MALAKMVKLAVTPWMPSSTKWARMPSWSDVRVRLSSHGGCLADVDAFDEGFHGVLSAGLHLSCHSELGRA